MGCAFFLFNDQEEPEIGDTLGYTPSAERKGLCLTKWETAGSLPCLPVFPQAYLMALEAWNYFALGGVNWN